MRRKINYYRQIIQTLRQLNKEDPTYNMGRHLSTALDGYSDMWGMTDKELLFSLRKYELELNNKKRKIYILKPQFVQNFIDQYEEGMNYDTSSSLIDSKTKKSGV